MFMYTVQCTRTVQVIEYVKPRLYEKLLKLKLTEFSGRAFMFLLDEVRSGYVLVFT